MVGIQFLNNYLKKPELVDYVAQIDQPLMEGEVPGYGPEIPAHMRVDTLRRMIPDFDRKRQMIQDAAMRGRLRGVWKR